MMRRILMLDWMTRARRAAPLVCVALLVVLAACGNATGTATLDHRLDPGKRAPGTTPAIITPGADLPSPTPRSTLPGDTPRPPSATLDPRTPTPDAQAFALLAYTYTAGMRPAKIILNLSADGYAHMRFGTRPLEGPLPAERLAQIRAALQATDFFALQDEYIPVRACCDLASYEIKLVMPDGRSKTVYMLGTVPDELSPLMTALSGIWQLLPTPTPGP
jgi:hypothetical protein